MTTPADADTPVISMDAIIRQNNDIADAIKKIEAQNFLNYQSSEYQRIQMNYLESIIYVLKYLYLGLLLLYLAVLYAQTRVTTHLASISFFVLYPFVILRAEFVLSNVLLWIFASMTGNVYIPINSKQNAYIFNGTY